MNNDAPAQVREDDINDLLEEATIISRRMNGRRARGARGSGLPSSRESEHGHAVVA